MRWPSVVTEWGSTAAERASSFQCDGYGGAADAVLWRAVDVAAPQAVTFRWLCQLRVAPYSYDKLDNFGRQSPQHLTPGLERLEIGQRFMTIFRLDEFEPGRSVTVTSRTRVFGTVTATYRADDAGAGASRIVVKMFLRYPRGPAGVLRWVLPPGDLVMMRRQLLNLKHLAERDAST
jgi:hypothetical protein